MDTTVRAITDLRAELGEGPAWDAARERLLWVDIERGLIHSTDPATGATESLDAGGRVGSAVPAADGKICFTDETGFALIDPGTGAVTRIADPETENGDSRFNDGKCDPTGRYWAGTLSYSRTAGSAALYCLDRDRILTKRVEGVTVSNGLCWDTRKSRMYYIDTPTKSVVAFDYAQDTGEISAPRIAFATPANFGSPDGMTIDDEGRLWIAFFHGGCVCRWDPDTGELIGRIDLPAPNITSCCFGGRDLDRLYITSARHAMTDEDLERYPLAGALFVVEPGVSGSPTWSYGG